MHVSLMIVNLQGPLLFPGSSSSSRLIIKLNGSLLSPGLLFSSRALTLWSQNIWIYCVGSLLLTVV